MGFVFVPPLYFFRWVGQRSMELFLLQCHVLMNHNAKKVPVWDSDYSARGGPSGLLNVFVCWALLFAGGHAGSTIASACATDVESLLFRPQQTSRGAKTD